MRWNEIYVYITPLFGYLRLAACSILHHYVDAVLHINGAKEQENTQNRLQMKFKMNRRPLWSNRLHNL